MARSEWILATLWIATLGAAAASPIPKAHPIAVFINGSQLRVDPAPRFYKHQLVVPVRRIIEALGLDYQRSGATIVTHAGYKTITLQIGSARASVDGEPILLELAPVDINGTLFAALRFFTAALGAQAIFDRKAARVEITSNQVGRSGNGITTSGSQTEEVGTITGIDLDSTPESITLTYNASVRTIAISSSARIVLRDVNTSTTQAGAAEDLHPGDYAHIFVRKDGTVDRIVDEFGSRRGSIAAVTDSQIVLDDGHVITPGKETTISLNGQTATLTDLKVSDTVMVGYNIDSDEIRQILATRAATGTPPPAGAVQISGIDLDLSHPLRAGESFDVTLRGTPGGTAKYDVGPYFVQLPMHEDSPGVYRGRYKIPSGVNFADVPIFGHLNVRGTDAPRAQSQTEISAASSPPGITDFAPDGGSVVNNPRPGIYATFTTDAVAVDPSSIHLIVNDRDVTGDCVRTDRFIEYTPGRTYSDGAVHVSVRVADLAGNVSTRSWVFTIKTH